MQALKINTLEQYYQLLDSNTKNGSTLILANPEKSVGIALQQQQALLDRYVKLYGVYDSIVVGNTTGKPIWQSTGQAVTRLGRDYFKAAIAL